jgi:hypothetical protein
MKAYYIYVRDKIIQLLNLNTETIMALMFPKHWSTDVFCKQIDSSYWPLKYIMEQHGTLFEEVYGITRTVGEWDCLLSLNYKFRCQIIDILSATNLYGTLCYFLIIHRQQINYHCTIKTIT